MKKKLVLSITLVLLISLGVFGWVFAQEETPEPPIPIEPPIIIEPPIWRFEGLKIEYQRVNVTIEEQVATTHIDQLFVNNNDRMLEGTYLFPLPDGAAVSQLTMWVDGTPIEAKILGQEEARQIYDRIVRQLRDPALLEYVGTSAIQANVFPIPARDRRRIEIEYSQILPADNGLIHYIYPQSTDLYTNTSLDNQSIRVEVRSNEEIRAIYSPSHPVAIDRDGDFRALVGYEASNILPDKDFELYYTVSPEDIGLNLLSFRESGQNGFFLLLVAPSVQATEVVAKDVILVLDTSGSMEGSKMQQAQEAAAYVISHLNEADRFNIVAFSTGVRQYAPELSPAAEPGNYRSFIDSLEPIGGTNISQALLEAVDQADPQRPTTIIFLTDGLATEGIVETPLLLDTVKQAASANVRVFAFGVGNDVDTTLLDSLTQNHRGTTTYVRPMQSIDEEVSSFYAKVSAPVLANISLDFGDIVVEQMYPQTLPDLFAGSQLVLTGRYREGGPATVSLRGVINGREQEINYPDNFFRVSGGDDFIPRIWATRAIGHLLTEIRLRGEDEELVQSVVNLSIRYGIITPYTSYLIEEDDILSQANRQTIVEEAMADFAAPAAVSGEAAVERAEEEGAMAEAEVVATAPTIVEVTRVATEIGAESDRSLIQPVQFVGDKTFIYRDGRWLDTAYDPDTQLPQQIGFATDAYFDLLSALPEAGQYLALGQNVLFVYGEQVYEIVTGEGQTTVVLPQPTDAFDQGIESTGPTTVVTAVTPTREVMAVEPVEPTGDRDESQRSVAPSLCTAAIAIPLMIGVGVVFGRRKERRS